MRLDVDVGRRTLYPSISQPCLGTMDAAWWYNPLRIDTSQIHLLDSDLLALYMLYCTKKRIGYHISIVFPWYVQLAPTSTTKNCSYNEIPSKHSVCFVANKQVDAHDFSDAYCAKLCQWLQDTVKESWHGKNTVWTSSGINTQYIIPRSCTCDQSVQWSIHNC